MLCKNYKIIRGDTFAIPQIQVVTDAGTAIDLTGSTFFFTAKLELDTNATDAVYGIKTSWTDHLNPTGGITSLTVSDTDTKITAGDYYYDIQMKSSTGEITTLAYGVLTILGEVTVRTT